MLETVGFAAVRCTAGKEWLDADTFSVLVSNTRDKVTGDNLVMGALWAGTNPVMRYVRCTVVEGETVPAPSLRPVMKV